MGLKYRALLTVMILIMTSCGKQVNEGDVSYFSKSNASFLLMEKNCSKKPVTPEPATVEIAKLYNDLLVRFPMHFFSIQPKYYDYKSPLIIRPVDLEKGLMNVKGLGADGTFLVGTLPQVVKDIYYLYHNSIRFEGQKCSLMSLAKNKKLDLRPYLEMRDFCLGKEGSEVCGAESFMKLGQNEKKLVATNVVNLCKSFDPRGGICEGQFVISRTNRTLGKLTAHYQKRFQSEFYNKLFLLRADHQKFSCTKKADSATIMTVKISSINWDLPLLEILTNYVSASWSNERFELRIILVEEKGSDVVEILPTNSGISYVPDNNNRQIFLSQRLDFETKKRVLAHEFGHVLGFPDCYTEFFDTKNRSLIYYELESGHTNIMCSLKAGGNVPVDYLTQLSEKSCVFN